MTEFHPGDRVRGKVSGKVGTIVAENESSAEFTWVDWDGNPSGHNPVGIGMDKLELISRPEPTEGQMENPSDLDTPATDSIGTVRVHPDDDPEDPHARRGIKTEDVPWWAGVTGVDDFVHDEEIATWSRQHWSDVARVLGHDVPAGFHARTAEVENAQNAAEEFRNRADRLERERDEARAVAGDCEARAEKAERDLQATRHEMARQAHRAELAEERASSWWEAAKTNSRALSFWYREAVALRGRADESEALGIALDQATQRAEKAEALLRHERSVTRSYANPDRTTRKPRVVEDADGDRWTEQPSGLFYCQAVGVPKSLDDVRVRYGPLTEITEH